MTRKPDPTRAARATPDTTLDRDYSLRLPGDWGDGSAASISEQAANDDLVTDGVGVCRVDPDNGEEGGEDDFASRMSAMLRAGPPKLVKAMLALDQAKNDDDFTAARAILRVSAF